MTPGAIRPSARFNPVRSVSSPEVTSVAGLDLFSIKLDDVASPGGKLTRPFETNSFRAFRNIKLLGSWGII